MASSSSFSVVIPYSSLRIFRIAFALFISCTMVTIAPKNNLQPKCLSCRLSETGIFIVKEIISSRLDGKALKAALPDVYGQFCKASTSRRFTIA